MMWPSLEPGEQDLDMIAWWWLIPTIVAGFLLGAMLMAALASSHIQELEADALEHLVSDPPSEPGSAPPE